MPSMAETSPLLEGLAKSEATERIARRPVEPASSTERKTLIYACGLTTFFFVVELVGGYVAHSLAIMSDAAHLLSDLAGLVISLIAVYVSRMPANSRHSFGFARAEVLGAFVSVFFIWALTAVLVVFAVHRLFNPQPVNGHLMLLLGTIGLFVNIALGLVLGHSHSHSHSHSHEHGHSHAHSHFQAGGMTPSPSSSDIEQGAGENHSHCSSHSQDQLNNNTDKTPGIRFDTSLPASPPESHQHQPQSKTISLETFKNLLFGTDIESVNVRAAYLHVLGDALQSIGVIIAAIVIILNPKISFVDPLCTLFFAALVIMTTAGLARDTIAVLMEATPPSINLDDIHHCLLRIDGVRRVGDLHVWSISARRPALSVHLYQKDNASSHDVLKQTRRILASEFNISHATVQINCEASECCDEKYYLGTEHQPKNCVTYDSLAEAPPPAIDVKALTPSQEQDINRTT